jgi:hypothetical protein
MKDNKILRILLPAVILFIILALVGKKAGWFGKELTVKVATEKWLSTRSSRLSPQTERYSPRPR